ncbi:LamG domain-containing protein [Paractinoplanes rishiriensis]|uniref:LamG domain-containing protein n=1 Tax=Paractinoplanes rishiriensis TaxID=1050105 RepID=UPI001EF1CDB3|nr:LamG domain-containing protein [Actinoplanes rishiriensis]
MWRLNGDGTDTGRTSHPLTAANLAWTPDGRQIGESVARFNGTSSALTGAPPIHTNTSFAVSAWLRPTRTSCSGTAVSQDGVHTSGFYLGCYQGRFSFNVIQTDSSEVYGTRVTSAAAAQAGVWSNVVGVYDLSENRIALYVNGVAQGSAPLSAPLWDAAGPFVVGRERYVDASGGWWAGDIADVRVWDRVIYQPDVDAQSAASWADHFPLGFDLAYNGRRDNPLTWNVEPEPGWDNMNPPDNGGTPAVMLSGGPRAVSAHSGVRTDGSFSVSAWIGPNLITGGNLSAVAQRGTMASNFSLGIKQETNQYQFRMNHSDIGWPDATVVAAPGTAVVDQWVHLTGTFDFTTRQMNLYVNGGLQASGTFGAAPWHAAGPVLVGAAWWQGVAADYWHGGIDNVALFNGVLTTAQIDNLYRYSDPFYVSPD